MLAFSGYAFNSLILPGNILNYHFKYPNIKLTSIDFIYRPIDVIVCKPMNITLALQYNKSKSLRSNFKKQPLWKLLK